MLSTYSQTFNNSKIIFNYIPNTWFLFSMQFNFYFSFLPQFIRYNYLYFLAGSTWTKQFRMPWKVFFVVFFVIIDESLSQYPSFDEDGK